MAKSEVIPEGMEKFTVVADAITISTGEFETKVGGAREERVVRMVQGETVIAPPDNPSVVEFLAMGGLVRSSEARKTFEKAGGGVREAQYRPMVERQEGMKGYRVTALNVALRMADGVEPGDIQTDVAPDHAPNPDLSLPGADVEGSAEV